MLEETLGFINKVEYVSDGYEALSMLKADNQGHFKLVLVDFNIPSITGLRVIEKYERFRCGSNSSLTNLTNRPHFVMVTAWLSDSDKEKAISLGVEDFLEKPITVNSMKRIIDKLEDQ